MKYLIVELNNLNQVIIEKSMNECAISDHIIGLKRLRVKFKVHNSENVIHHACSCSSA